MNDLQNLQERVQRMLDGETKRREIAIKWLYEIEKILLPVAGDIWGEGDCFNCEPSGTTTLTKVDNNNNEICSFLYFRFDGTTGFYDGSYTNCNNGGKPIEDLKGPDFWNAIRIIINWIPLVTKSMDKREDSRNALLNKIK